MKKIWIDNSTIIDSYVDFSDEFRLDKKAKTVTVDVSADSNFVCKINGEVVGFGCRANYPNKPEHYVFDIKPYVREVNTLTVTVWYYGEKNHSYIVDSPFLAYRCFADGKLVSESDENTLCRYNPYFKQNYRKKITPQLGFGFLYDARKSETEYRPSIVVGTLESKPKSIEPLQLLASHPSHITKREDGYLVDLGEEVVGFLTLSVDCQSDERLVVSYGEDLENGLPRRFIAKNDFSVEYIAHKGKNLYTNYFRRIAGRYLFVAVDDPNGLTVEDVSIRPVEYPVKTVDKKFKDKTLQKIYDVGIRTLKCCMHEHYEDCPWREQAMYVLDCRNQMLCGYTAFEGTAYQRDNILKIADGIGEDGLLPLCALSNVKTAIPFFSLFFPITVAEYVRYTSDTSLLKETETVIETVMKTFAQRVDANGLIPSFDYPYWNFYEWTKGSDHWDDYANKTVYRQAEYDFILNAMFVYAQNCCNELLGTKFDTEGLKSKLKEVFYDKEKKTYVLSTNQRESSVLCNSLAVLIGISDRATEKNLLRKKDMVDISLSMNPFYFDALLKIGKSAKKRIVKIIKKQYGKMIENSATTFWETEKGAADFNGSGSLCHGWSAVPVYYLDVLCEKKKGDWKV